MEIIKIYPRGFGANTYILTADNKTAVVIDPAQNRIESELIKRELTAKFVLLTHCHFDHVAGVAVLQKSGAKVLCSEKETPLVGTQADLFELFGAPREAYTVDETLKDNETRTLCGIEIQTLYTAGHTAGSVSYLVKDGDKKYLFTGDMGVLRQSLRRLSALEDIPVYSGHGEETTLETERKTNPFLIDL